MTLMRIRGFATILFLGVLLTLISPLPAQAVSLPDQAYIRGLEGHAQSLSLSCEARSAADWAAFWGVSIRERKFLAKLPRSDNPDSGFVGTPSEAWGDIPPKSYGVYAEPVAALLREYGLQAEARRGMKLDELRTEVAAGRPVIVWVIGQMWRGTPVKYTTLDGHKTTVARFEHTMIVIGYDQSTVSVVDAYYGKIQTYPLPSFLASWGTLGNMAIVGQVKAEELPVPPKAYPHQVFMPAVLSKPPEAQAVPEPVQSPPKTYVVKRGDFLVGVARSLGVNWRKLAAKNGIGFPYIIYTGQVLKIP